MKKLLKAVLISRIILLLFVSGFCFASMFQEAFGVKNSVIPESIIGYNGALGLLFIAGCISGSMALIYATFFPVDEKEAEK